jgi:hypothetical protein
MAVVTCRAVLLGDAGARGFSVPLAGEALATERITVAGAAINGLATGLAGLDRPTLAGADLPLALWFAALLTVAGGLAPLVSLLATSATLLGGCVIQVQQSEEPSQHRCGGQGTKQAAA